MAEQVPLEADITRAIQRMLAKRAGWWGYKVAGGAAQMRGVPDIVGCYRGRLVALEIKRPHVGRLSPLQALRIDQIRAAGGVAEVVTSPDEVSKILDSLDQG